MVSWILIASLLPTTALEFAPFIYLSQELKHSYHTVEMCRGLTTRNCIGECLAERGLHLALLGTGASTAACPVSTRQTLGRDSQSPIAENKCSFG